MDGQLEPESRDDNTRKDLPAMTSTKPTRSRSPRQGCVRGTTVSRMRTVLLAAAAGLLLAGCGGGEVSTSGKDVSMATVTDANAEQACIDLFGKANDLGAKFSEADFTWTGSQYVSGGVVCALTPVGKTLNQAPVTLRTTNVVDEGTVSAGNGWYVAYRPDTKGAWSDEQKQAVADLAAKAAKHIKP
jgi:hypothetical protein